jgi:hypothetical protein
MNWYKFSQENRDIEDVSIDKAKTYFSVGHGRFNEKLGFDPLYFLWAIKEGSLEVIGPFASEGRILHDPVIKERSDKGEILRHGASHAIHWGRYNIPGMFRGRFEPEIGVLTLIKPSSFLYRSVPGNILNLLYKRFNNIKKILVI